MCVCVKQKVYPSFERLIKDVPEVEINKKHKLLLSIFSFLSPKLNSQVFGI